MKFIAALLLGGLLMADSAPSLYDVKLSTLDGKPTSLAAYKGKTLVIVNTASKCGYTPQYEGLEALYTKYKDKGVVVLGFPSNDFGGQEPGTNAEIKAFCTTKYKVDFPMFDKGPVKGESKQPLYGYLTSHAPAGQQGEIKWNFEKFVVSADGKIVGRFDSKVKPEDPAFQALIDKNLPPKAM